MTVAASTGLVLLAAPSNAGAPSRTQGASLAAFEPVGVNHCYSTDNGDPRLVEFRYSPGTVRVVDQRAEVRFRVRARDTGGPDAAEGVGTVSVWFGKGPGDEVGGTEGHDLVQEADGWWTGSAIVPRRAPHHLWRIEGLGLQDRAGNAKNYDRTALRTLTGRSLDVSIDTARDRTPPRLTDFSVTPEAIDTRSETQHVTFTARMVDRQSDVDMVVVDGRGDTSWISPESGSISLENVPGTLHLFRARVPVGLWVGDRAWNTDDVWAWNSADEPVLNSRRELRDLGFAGDFSVLSGTDRVRAQAHAFDVSPTSVDVRTTTAPVSFRVRATDVGSGVHSVIASTDTEDFWVEMTRESGTAEDGIWSGTVHLPHCTTATTRWRLQLLVYDRNGGPSGGARFYDTEELAALGWQHRLRVIGSDHERPSVDLDSRPRAGAWLRLTFTEPVQGIDRANASVQRIRPDRSLGPAVTGRWRCRDGAGDPEDCRDGAVVIGRFRPEHGLRTGHRYAVALNPEHHLGITDLAGNPLRQTTRRSRAVR